MGIRPDMFMAYATNARVLHQHGSEASVLRLLTNAVRNNPCQSAKWKPRYPHQEHRKVVADVSRWSRDAGFNRTRPLRLWKAMCRDAGSTATSPRSTHPPRRRSRQRRPRPERNRPRAHLPPRLRRRAHLPRRALPNEAQRRTTTIPARPQPRGRNRSVQSATRRNLSPCWTPPNPAPRRVHQESKLPPPNSPLTSILPTCCAPRPTQVERTSGR